MKFFRLCLVVFGAHTLLWGKPIPVQITVFGLSPKNEVSTLAVVRSGIQSLEKSLQKYCGIEKALHEIEPHFIPRKEGKLALERTQNSNESIFPFRFYQQNLWETLKRYEFAPAPEQISILLFDKVETMGHAFPRVQFPKLLERSAHHEELKLMLNRIVLEPPHQSPNATKIVAHEIAHLLIQDDPPHTCETPRGREACPPENILTTYKWIPRLNPQKRNRFSEDFNSEDGLSSPYEFEDPQFKKVFSSGMELEKSQCESIYRHLETFGEI